MFLLLLILATTTLWFFLRYTYSHWNRKGFPSIKPTIPFGNVGATAKREKSFGMDIYDLYDSTTEPYVGIYVFLRPTLLVRDAKLVKNILTKDFSSFHDRGVYVDEDDPLSGNLFGLKGNKWKTLRAKLTPTFSSGKLKNMFVTIEATGKSMVNYLQDTLPAEGDIVELKDLYSRYAIDIIASVIFGIETNSFTNPDNEFRAVATRFTQPSTLSNLFAFAKFLCPSLIKFLPTPKSEAQMGEFLVDVVKETIAFREKNNYTRKDMMQLLLQLRNTGKVGNDEVWDVESVAENLKQMSIEQIASQLFLFFIAGFDSSASSAAFCIHELTQNKDIMEKVKEDIAQSLQNHNGQLTYDSIQDMKYLDLCLTETLRKYPVLPILNRQCTENYPVPGSDHVIEKDTPIIISLMGLHRDPKYFPDPLKFEPERFSPDNKKYDEDAFYPFGEGPRSCIGVRMGKMNVKVGVVMLLTKFHVEAVEPDKEIEFDLGSVALLSKDGIKVKVTPINN